MFVVGLPMTLDEFLTKMHSDIEAFGKWWREQHEQNPEGFPIQPPPGTIRFENDKQIDPTSDEELWFREIMDFLTDKDVKEFEDKLRKVYATDPKYPGRIRS